MTLPLLVSLEDFQNAQGREHDPTIVADLLAVEGASDTARRYCGQTFGYVADDEVTMPGTGTWSLLLPQVPVHDVGGVVEIDSDDEEETVDATEWIFDVSGIVRKRHGQNSWGWGTWRKHRLYRVTYTHGYLLPDQEEVEGVPRLPWDLRRAVIQLAARELATAPTGGRVAAEKQVGTFRVRYEEAASTTGAASSPEAVLERYRVPHAA